MTITRVASPAAQANLFTPAHAGDWGKEMELRTEWSKSLKTVEAAKDKEEGLKARAKGKRGGDASRGNVSTLHQQHAADDSAVSTRRGYQYRPEGRNPIMAGAMRPESYRPGVRKVEPPREKKQPKTHKVVNMEARLGTLVGPNGEGGSYAALAGTAADNTSGSPRAQGRRCFGMIGMETEPPKPRPSGKAGRRLETDSTVPWRFAQSEESTDSVDYRRRYQQRYGCTPDYAHTMHTFANDPKPARYPHYRPQPPYSVGY